MENTTSALKTLGRLRPEIRLSQALSEFEATLNSTSHKAKFKNFRTRRPPDLEDVVRLTEEINRDGARLHSRWQQYGTRLVTILDRVRQFAPIGDVVIGGSQNMVASGIWGAIRLALEVVHLPRIHYGQLPKYTENLPSDAEITNIMNNLPRDLPEALDQALMRIHDHLLGSRILGCVAAADPSMTVLDLTIAVTVEPGNLEWDLMTCPYAGLTFATHYGGDVLEVDEEDQKVRFIHHCILLHLVGPFTHPSARAFHFGLSDAMSRLASVYITFLNFPMFNCRVSLRHKPLPIGQAPAAVVESVSSSSALGQVVLALFHDRQKETLQSYDMRKFISELAKQQ